jgi:hypothetical protein
MTEYVVAFVAMLALAVVAAIGLGLGLDALDELLR